MEFSANAISSTTHLLSTILAIGVPGVTPAGNSVGTDTKIDGVGDAFR